MGIQVRRTDSWNSSGTCRPRLELELGVWVAKRQDTRSCVNISARCHYNLSKSGFSMVLVSMTNASLRQSRTRL
jgi:hypothetical protein